MYSLKSDYEDIELSKDDFDWLMGQLKSRQAAKLLKDMTKYSEIYGLGELRCLVQRIANENK